MNYLTFLEIQQIKLIKQINQLKCTISLMSKAEIMMTIDELHFFYLFNLVNLSNFQKTKLVSKLQLWCNQNLLSLKCLCIGKTGLTFSIRVASSRGSLGLSQPPPKALGGRVGLEKFQKVPRVSSSHTPFSVLCF